MHNFKMYIILYTSLDKDLLNICINYEVILITTDTIGYAR